MKITFTTLNVFAMLLAGLPPLTAADMQDALPETVSIPLPLGQSISFSLIPVSEDENLFASFEFAMGESADADFPVKAAPTTVAGTVYTNGAWTLPMGCTEVTKAQYAAIMSPDAMPPEAEANLPQTSVTRLEVQQFIEKLNIWLQTDEKAKAVMAGLASSKKHGTPFVNLPHEAEWEFSARGATLVSQAQFADSIPYDDEEDLARSENVATQKGSKLKPVGATKKCNPCGLYDMFGNAEEMVEGAFRAEYAFGRSGAAVVRGADFLTKAEDATSYRRREVPLFDEKHLDKPYSKATIGFRLSMGSAIYTNAVIGSLDDEWSEHDAKRIVINPNDSTRDSTNDKIGKDEARLAKQLDLIASRLDKDPANAKALAQIELLKSHTDEMKKKIDAADQKTAKAGTSMIYNISFNALKDSVALATFTKALRGDNDPNASKADKLRKNIETEKAEFIEACEMLMTASPEIVTASLQAKRDDIVRKLGINSSQVPLFEITISSFEKIRKNGAVTSQLVNEWADSIGALAKKNIK